MFAARSIVDPCEILLSPSGHWLNSNVIDVPSAEDVVQYPLNLEGLQIGYDMNTNYVNLIVAQSATNATYVDNALVTSYVAIGASGYYGTQILVTNGVHTIISSQPVEVQVYGFGNYDAYGYFGGTVK